MRRPLLILIIIAALLLTGTALAASTHWTALKSVTVSTQKSTPSGFKPAQVKTFTTAAQLKTVTAALNANRIALGNHPNHSGVCMGGVNVKINIVDRQGNNTTLQAYQCGKATYGTVSGKLVPFLKAIGLPV